MSKIPGIPEFVTAICPPNEIVAGVRQLKQSLFERIDWYGSYKAEAHITFEPFDAGIKELEERRKLLQQFAASQQPVNLNFNAFDFFKESHTVFLSADEESLKLLRRLHRDYNKFFPPPPPAKPFHPHLTIGRALKPDQFEAAKKLFMSEKVGFSFRCDNIALRQYNGRQYDIVERFYFTASEELSLF